jgi:ligand-binding sensor domain-containing protein/signal transduction histidine kinase/AraC-like DNA-binding protein
LAYAQDQIKFRQLSVNDGLSQNSAVSIAQDSIGFLWIATQDGLNKYDGSTFSIYPFTFADVTRATHSYLGKVYVDRRGDVWAIPNDRIPYKLDTKSNIFVPLQGIKDASSIYMDADLNLWIGTYSNGLYIKKAEKEEVGQMLSPNIAGGTIYNIIQNENDVLLLCMDNEIVEYDYKNVSLKKVKAKNANGNSVIANFSDIVTDNSAREWIGTFGSGLFFRKPEDGVFNRIEDLGFKEGLSKNLNITDLHMDSRDRLWIATYGQGLYLVNLEELSITQFGTAKHNPTALHYNDILSIYEDYSGTLWFGTDGAGISYYDEYLEKFNSFTDYQTPENVSIDVVRAIVVDREKSVWIGTSGKGLTQYSPDTNGWRTFKAGTENDNRISSDRVMSLLVDKEDNLWIGTQDGGLNMRDPNGDIIHFFKGGKGLLSANTIWSIYQDDRDRMWLGTRDQGLIQFDREKGELKRYDYDPIRKHGIPSNNVRAITSDNEGNLWIGTEGHGIAHFNTEEETFTTHQFMTNGNSLSSNRIKCLYHAPNNILWIGTNGAGLNAYDLKGNLFYQFTASDGLPNNVIYGILPDNEGSLWLSSNKGITKFTPAEKLEDAPTIVNYNNYEGLATEFNTGAYFKDKDGNLYFGGLDGFYWFKPNKIKENTTVPKVAITGFDVYNTSFPIMDGQALKANQNTISFSFSGLQYSLPEKNQYQYKLVNFDSDWVYSGQKNFARYTRLPPGDYEFQVKASNYDGVWNQKPVGFSFSIMSPWYLTPIAKFSYVILFLLLAYGVYSYLKWQWRLQLNLRLKMEETERFKKLNRFKSKLYTDISHEFRTPLTLISGPVDMKLSQGGLSDMDFANFSMIKRNINRLIALVDQLLHLAKLEKGKLKLKISKGDMGLFLGMLTSSFRYRAGIKRIDYKVEIEELRPVWFDEDALEKIIINLLSNAFKYVSEGGMCQFIARREGGTVEISVKNTVEQYSEVDLDNLFTRFYQQNEYSEGAGVGLSVVKELVNLYQGSITVKMEEAKVIHFLVRLPLLKSHFANLEVLEIGAEVGEPGTYNDHNEFSLPTQGAALDNDSGTLPILLIVEDHKEVREFLGSAWKTRYRIVEAVNGLEGINTALEVVPDIIISDVRMPFCDGIELCNKLKTDERTSHIPIILLTAGIGEDQELLGLQSGADDFITKPFKLKLLQTRVDNLIGNRKMLRNRYSHELILEVKDVAITPTDEVFLNKLQSVLDDHLADPLFNAEAFCEKLAMSRMQLHRKLLAYTGLSTTAFIRSQRLKQAVHILKTSDASISEIAYAVGFNTPSYFIKCFRETYKKTPKEYLDTYEQ